MMLQLEYTCTEAELKEAQSLDLHRQCGSGPKWRSGVVYYAFIAFIATLVYLRFKMEIAPKDRLWFIALVVVIFIALQIFKGMTRRKTDQLVRLEVSEREVVSTAAMATQHCRGRRSASAWNRRICMCCWIVPN